MAHGYNYSPKPIDAYRLHGVKGGGEAGAIADLERAQAVWNIFWLSVPALDALPDSGPGWYKVYSPIKDAARCFVADVMFDEVLYRKLCMHPVMFASWFEREDQTIYDAYDILGERAWVDRVLVRAHQSAHRMAMETPALTTRGTVIHALLGRNVA